jgi:large subunit ribosomal protein L21
MYAVVRDRSRCLHLTPGQEVWVDLLDAEPGAEVTFGEVQLLRRDDGSVAVGAPAVSGAAVLAEVLRHDQDQKVHASFFRRRKASRKRTGHRQSYTRVRIKEIRG